MNIGYTGGTFDLFHIGHLNLLRGCKKHCDYLIVGVSTDELIKKYKKTPPIIPLVERMEIIRELECVDEVVIQETLDKVKMCDRYNPNYLFIGDDWLETDDWEEYEKKLVYTTTFIYLPYTKNISSTIIKERIKNETRND